MNSLLIKALRQTLDNWSKLDDGHKGKDFEKSKNNLGTWLVELQNQLT